MIPFSLPAPPRVSAPLPSFAQLPMPQKARRGLVEALAHRSGLILVAGSTGSGKTVASHAMLQLLADQGRRIVAFEEVIERDLPFAKQVQCKLQADGEVGVPTFEEALAGALSEEHDVCLIGDFSSPGAAAAAVALAHKGALVIVNMHANNAHGAVIRMRHCLATAGGEPAALPLPLRASLWLRLYQRPCPLCATYTKVNGIPRGVWDRMQNEWLVGRDGYRVEFMRSRSSSGCPTCHQTGFNGRASCFDLITLRESIPATANSAEVDHLLSRHHALTARESAVILAAAGNACWNDVRSDFFPIP